MTTAIHKLPAHAPPSERVALAQGRGDRAFLGPEDVNYEEWALGEKVSLSGSTVYFFCLVKYRMYAYLVMRDGSFGTLHVAYFKDSTIEPELPFLTV